MELREYWRVFKRRAWIPILLVIVTAATAGVLTYLAKPEYTATAQVSAKSQGPNTNGQTASFPEVAAGNNVAKIVVDKLKLSQTPDELSNRIKVSSGKSDVYSITITDANADQAVRVANAVAAAAAIQYQTINSGLDVNGATSVFDDQVQLSLKAYRQRFLDAETALLTFRQGHPGAAQSRDLSIAAQDALLQADADVAGDAYHSFMAATTADDEKQLAQANVYQAIVSEQAIAKPDTTSRFFKIGYAAALALILGIGLIFVLEYLDNAIRLPEAAEEMIGAPVVGIIPRANVHTLRPAKGGAA
jgi:capsular polysaccharide biosynthesis protein